MIVMHIGQKPVKDYSSLKQKLRRKQKRIRRLKEKIWKLKRNEDCSDEKEDESVDDSIISNSEMVEENSEDSVDKQDEEAGDKRVSKK